MATNAISDKPGKLILYLGADWWGSDARALAVALRQQGHSLIEVEYEDYLPPYWSSFPLKVLRRLIRPLCVANYNEAVRRHLDNPAIDFMLVFKGMMLQPATLAAFQSRKIPIYCFYPDVGFASFGSDLVNCLPIYDCFFTTKEFHLRDNKLKAQVRDMQLVRHGFDLEVHRSVRVGEVVKKYYACDISFVGCWSPKKERLVAAVVKNLPDCMVKLWGPGWNNAGEAMRRCWAGRGAFGDELAIIYQVSKINLGLLSEAATDMASGDQTTVRTWQIPASGGFLLHEATAELEQFLTTGKEVATFTDSADLVTQVAYYLAHPEERIGIAAAGQQRCVAGQYTYAAAAGTVCAYHESRKLKTVFATDAQMNTDCKLKTV